MDKSVLHIEGEMTIYQAHELKQRFVTELARSTTLELNLAAVTDLDTAGVQLLILMKKMAQAAQRELHLVAHSLVVLDVFETFNLVAYFGDPILIDPDKKGVL